MSQRKEVKRLVSLVCQPLWHSVCKSEFLHFFSMLRTCADPSRWSREHVQLWLQWAVQNFSFEGVDASRFDGCSGADLLQQGRDCLLQRAPLYVGDILWEHLDILQKGESQVDKSFINPLTPTVTINVQL